jgi:hypothetical protein
MSGNNSTNRGAEGGVGDLPVERGLDLAEAVWGVVGAGCGGRGGGRARRRGPVSRAVGAGCGGRGVRAGGAGLGLGCGGARRIGLRSCRSTPPATTTPGTALSRRP